MLQIRSFVAQNHPYIMRHIQKIGQINYLQIRFTCNTKLAYVIYYNVSAINWRRQITSEQYDHVLNRYRFNMLPYICILILHHVRIYNT